MTTFVSCPKRQQVLNEAGSVLVTGGPGSGKTRLALEKARRLISEGLRPGQSVLFLSFSRAAVARVVDASKLHLSKDHQRSLSIQTFHSFFWEVLSGHGYLLGAPKTFRILLPHDEVAMRHHAENEGANWEVEREKLFAERGLVAFDLFASKAYELFRRSERIRNLFSARHPLIIVDEAQDTAEDQWQAVRLLSLGSQLFCLADLDQQIYDFRPGVSSERVTHIMSALNPLRVDLVGDNHRSTGSEILTFGNDVLLGTPRGSRYSGVSQMKFRAQRVHRDTAIRQAVGRAIKSAKDANGGRMESLAVLATWGRGVNIISQALSGEGSQKSISHRVLIDDASVLLSSRLVAFMLEPRRPETHELQDAADALELAAAIYRGRGKVTNLSKAEGFAISAIQCRNGTKPRANSVAAKTLEVLRRLRSHKFTGDPKQDWQACGTLLRQSGAVPLREIAEDAESLIAFLRGRRIEAGFADLWQSKGSYMHARNTLDSILAEDQLLSSMGDSAGIHVMTIHKAKGKEFDAVILFDEPNSSPFVSQPTETAPHTKCRKLLRVGITRARHHVLLLTDRFTPTELLKGHVL